MKIKKFLTSFVSIVLLCVMLSTQVLATGIGDAGLISGGASSTPNPGVALHFTGTKNIVGYRFSVYATDGTLLGHPAEIMLDETLKEQLERPNYKSPVSYMPGYCYYSFVYSDKPELDADAQQKSHFPIDKLSLSAGEKSDDNDYDVSGIKKSFPKASIIRRGNFLNPDTGKITVMSYDNDAGVPVPLKSPGYDNLGYETTYLWSSVKDDPTYDFADEWKSKMSSDTTEFFSKDSEGNYTGWLKVNDNRTCDNTYGVKLMAGLDEEDVIAGVYDNTYIFVEPIIAAKVQSGRSYVLYCLTVSEWALYQSGAMEAAKAITGQNDVSSWTEGVGAVNLTAGMWYRNIARWTASLYPASLYITREEVADKLGENANFWGRCDSVELDKTDTENYPGGHSTGINTEGSIIGKSENGGYYYIGAGQPYRKYDDGTRYAYNSAQSLIETMVGVGVYYDPSKVNLKAHVYLNPVDSTRTNCDYIGYDETNTVELRNGTDTITFTQNDTSKYLYESTSKMTDLGDVSQWKLYIDGAKITSMPLTIIGGDTVCIDYYSVTLNIGKGISSAKLNNNADSSTVIVLHGTEVSFDATAASGYSGVLWSTTGTKPQGAICDAAALTEKVVPNGNADSYKKLIVYSQTKVNVESVESETSYLYIYPHLDVAPKFESFSYKCPICPTVLEASDTVCWCCGNSITPVLFGGGKEITATQNRLYSYVGELSGAENYFGETCIPWDGFYLVNFRTSDVEKYYLADYWDEERRCAVIPNAPGLSFSSSMSWQRDHDDLSDGNINTAELLYDGFKSHLGRNRSIHLYYYTVTAIAEDGVKGAKIGISGNTELMQTGDIQTGEEVTNIYLGNTSVSVCTCDPDKTTVTKGWMYGVPDNNGEPPGVERTFKTTIGTGAETYKYDVDRITLDPLHAGPVVVEIRDSMDKFNVTVVTRLNGEETAIFNGGSVHVNYTDMYGNVYEEDMPENASRFTISSPQGVPKGTLTVSALPYEFEDYIVYPYITTGSKETKAPFEQYSLDNDETFYIDYYTLDLRGEEGHIAHVEGQGIYLKGQIATYTAEPAAGYHDAKWYTDDTTKKIRRHDKKISGR